MNRRLIIIFVALLFTVFFHKGAAQKRYNVIFINVDDLGIMSQLYGNNLVPTPNLQRLAQHGVTFRNVYTQYTLCSPSRTCLYSGKRPPTTKVTDNIQLMHSALGLDYRFINEYFHDFGYRTECYGKFTCNHEKEITWDKYYNAGKGKDDGFAYSSDGSGNRTEKTDGDAAQEPFWYIDTTSGGLSKTTDGMNTTRFINTLDTLKSRPFFVNLGIQTHNPFTPLLQFWNKTGDSVNLKKLPVDSAHTYTNIIGNGSSNIPLPASPPDDTTDIPPVAMKESFHYPDSSVQNLRHAYYAEIMQMDSLVGSIIDKIDEKNLWDSSVIVFWSDHGLSMGEHNGQWLKLNMFEEALRVPLIICAPHRQKGIWCERPVELVDIFQTMTELCNVPPQGDQEGASIAPLLDNPSFEWKKAIFSYLRRDIADDSLMGVAARNIRWHFNDWDEKGAELYDRQNDSNEITNLALNAAYIDTAFMMQSFVYGGWQAAMPPAYTRKTYYKDADGDGFGISTDSLWAYAKLPGYALKWGDCNDNDNSINPLAEESPCNGKDDNCNSKADENRPVPIIKATGSLDICLTGRVTLTTNAGAGFIYQWERNGYKIPGATKKNYTATTTGSYAVNIRKAGCSNISSSVYVYSGCSPLTEALGDDAGAPVLSHSAFVSPNPSSSGMFMLNYTSSSDTDLNIAVYSATGQSLLVKEINIKQGLNKYNLNLSAFSPGIYILVLNGTERIKLVRN